MTPSYTESLIARFTRLAPDELEAWVIEALSYPGTPLQLNRESPDYAFTQLLNELYAHHTAEAIKLNRAVRRLVRRYVRGRVELSDEMAESLFLIVQGDVADEPMELLMVDCIDGDPKHSPRLRLRMMQHIVRCGHADKEFWLRHLHNEGGALTSAAFEGLLQVDRDRAVAELSSLRPAEGAGALGISYALEKHINQPEHFYLLPKIIRQLPRISFGLQDSIAEWVAEVYPQRLEQEERKLKAHWDASDGLMLSFPAGVGTKADAAFLGFKVFPKETTDELRRRGYDLRTLRFEISPNMGDVRFEAERPEGMTHEAVMERMRVQQRYLPES